VKQLDKDNNSSYKHISIKHAKKTKTKKQSDRNLYTNNPKWSHKEMQHIAKIKQMH